MFYRGGPRRGVLQEGLSKLLEAEHDLGLAEAEVAKNALLEAQISAADDAAITKRQVR